MKKAICHLSKRDEKKKETRIIPRILATINNIYIIFFKYITIGSFVVGLLMMPFFYDTGGAIAGFGIISFVIGFFGYIFIIGFIRLVMEGSYSISPDYDGYYNL